MLGVGRVRDASYSGAHVIIRRGVCVEYGEELGIDYVDVLGRALLQPVPAVAHVLLLLLLGGVSLRRRLVTLATLCVGGCGVCECV